MPGFQEPIPYTGLLCPALVQGRSLVLPQPGMPCHVDTHGSPDPFWIDAEEEWMVEWKGSGRSHGVKWGRGNSCWDVNKAVNETNEK